MSDMRRAAKGLVETREERFESRYPLEESRRRLEVSLARAAPLGSVGFVTEWSAADGGEALLVARFSPGAGALRLLKLLSIGIAALIAASAWALLARDAAGPAVFLLPLIAVLAVLGAPFVALGLASQREAEEARIRKAIRTALRGDEASTAKNGV